MAYAFPASEGGGHNHGHGHTLASGTHSTPSGRNSRKGSEDAFDVLKEFKHKIDEDEHYIEFFQERIRIEEGYIKQLQRLLDRTVAIDSLHDETQRTKTTARKGWVEVRDYTSREVESRVALVGALKSAIIPDLARIKDEQERIRSGLIENVRVSNEMYDDHFKNHVPRLKKTYWQKCQALEEHKRQEAAILAQARLLSTPSPSSPAGSPSNEYTSPIFGNVPLAAANAPSTSSTAGPNMGGLADTPYFSPPRSTNALPSQPGGLASNQQTPSHVRRTSNPSSRNRDRASSLTGGGQGEKKDPIEVFQDLAVQGKKGFNAFMQKLGGDKGEKERDEGGFVIVGGGGREDDGMGLQRRTTGRGTHGKGQESGALKAVRAKRELDDADKAYRSGVFHLESLRLRREKVQTSALTNLEQFNDDLTVKLQRALSTYVDIVHATAATNAQATDVARQAVSRIDPRRDSGLKVLEMTDDLVSIFRSRMMTFRGPQSTPIPYENFYVGPCRSLIFGISLSDYDFARGEGGDHGRPPTIVEKCIAAIDQKGFDAEGLYRISGRKAGVQKMIQDIELDEEKFAFDDSGDVHSVANVLKQYLRELPEPVFLLPHPERVKITENREQLISSNFAALRSRLRRLPPIHQTTFQAIIEHLGRVQSRSAQNKMGAKNLAVIFNSVLFGADGGPDAMALTLHHHPDTVLEDLITYSDLLFSTEVDSTHHTNTSSSSVEKGVDENIGSSRTRMKIIDSPTTAGPSGTRMEDSVGSLKPEKTEVDISSVKSTFTPDSDLELLYDPRVIPAMFRESLGSDYHVRPLASTDLMRSHFTLLADLTSSPPIAPSLYSSIFKHLRSTPGTYYITVIVDKADDQLVAAATLFVERKHIHAGGSAGHIEEVVVSSKTQGKGLGLKLVRGLKEMGEQLGCYKTILDCGEAKVGFYEKCGFKRRGVQMAYYSASTESSPMFAPSLPFPGSNNASRQGSSLALPDLRAPPLPPRPTDFDSTSLTFPVPTSPPGQGSGLSDGTSASSPASRVTYTFPSAGVSPQHGGDTAAWANMENESTSPTPKRTQSPLRERVESLTDMSTPLQSGPRALTRDI